ncbi:unnamed protein product [Parajaminaea phylloscopi]
MMLPPLATLGVVLTAAAASFTGAHAQATSSTQASPSSSTSPAASSESASSSSCFPLKGSTMCPSFSQSSLSPSNLTASYPFFANVTDVASFDSFFARYFRDYGQFKQTKIHTGLQCNETGMRNATLQWAQTVLCGQFASMSYNAGCTAPRNQSSPLVCRETCTDFADSEQALVANASMCTPTRRLRPQRLVTLRNDTLQNDHDGCTSWTDLYSTDNSTCVLGASNEPNCGWGSGISDQLCSYCDTANGRSIATCCYDAKTNLSGCAALGYRGAALVRATTTIPAMPTSTSPTKSGNGSSGDDDDEGTGKRFSSGQLAGIIIGCILGALLLGALLAWLLFTCCCGGSRKRRQEIETEAQSDRQGMIAGAAAAPSASPREKAYNLSEDTNRHPSMSAEKVPYNHGPGMHDSHVVGGGYGGPGMAAAGLAGAGAGALAAKGTGQDSQNSRPLSTATSGTDGRGTTVPSVRCQYTGQEITPGESVVAIYPYSAGLSDELDLQPETREDLTVVRIYDDGWCLLRRSDGREGAAPLVCCQSSRGELPAHMRMGDSTGTGTGSGTTDDETGMTSGAEGMTSSVGGAVTADEHGFTSDAASR